MWNRWIILVRSSILVLINTRLFKFWNTSKLSIIKFKLITPCTLYIYHVRRNWPLCMYIYPHIFHNRWTLGIHKKRLIRNSEPFSWCGAGIPVWSDCIVRGCLLTPQEKITLKNLTRVIQPGINSLTPLLMREPKHLRLNARMFGYVVFSHLEMIIPSSSNEYMTILWRVFEGKHSHTMTLYICLTLWPLLLISFICLYQLQIENKRCYLLCGLAYMWFSLQCKLTNTKRNICGKSEFNIAYHTYPKPFHIHISLVMRYDDSDKVQWLYR